MLELGISRAPLPERRASFTEAYTAALLAVATGTAASDPTITAAVETAAQWWGRALAVADVSPTIVARAVTPGLGTLWEIGGGYRQKGGLPCPPGERAGRVRAAAGSRMGCSRKHAGRLALPCRLPRSGRLPHAHTGGG